MKLRKDDLVEVISGKDKGKQGRIISAHPATNKIVVEGVNIAKRHQKARNANTPAGIIEKPMPIDASNVMLVVGGKRTRVGWKIGPDGTKVRVARKTGEEIR
jgi:large subunit ribosomal protein L24